MKKLVVVLTLGLFTLTSCKKPVEDNIDISNNEEMETNKVLSISFYDDGIRLDDLNNQIALFEKQNKDLKIKINTVDESDKYKLKISTNLMSNTSDDIIDCLFLDYYKIASSGKVIDFNKLISEDEAFNKEDYYMNVLDAFSYNGGIYLFPAIFNYNLVGVNRNISSEFASEFEKYDSVNSLDMIKLYNSLDNKDNYNVEQSFSVYNTIFNQLLKYVDFNNKTCNFNNSEFIELIEKAKVATEKDNKNFIGYKFWDMFDEEREATIGNTYAFQEITSSNYQYFLPYEHKFFNTHVPLKNGDNKIEIKPGGGFLISEDSSNKDIAWSFLKFLASYSGTTNNPLFSIPLNRNAFLIKAENMINLTIRDLESFKMYLSDEIRKEIYNLQNSHNASNNKPKCVEDAIKAIDTMNQQPMAFTNWFGLFDIIKQEIEPFMNDTSTAEQVANGLQNKVFLYLNE